MELGVNNTFKVEMNIVEWINYYPKVLENLVRYDKVKLDELAMQMLKDKLGYKSTAFILRKPSKLFVR